MDQKEKTKYWVTMTDTCLSGWGMAKGKINKLVISTSGWEEALIVRKNASHRPEMKYIYISTTRPTYPTKKYFVNYHGRDEGDYDKWFIPNAF
jgi:hypothetical protein